MATQKSTKPKALSDTALALIAARFRALSDPVITQLCEIMCARLKAEHAELGRALP